ncbi:hypothetical protein [Exiguobacterium sp. s163]|uniref:hypothetical protein n=1 Tax=Exiguobacterium sp. s163 TaxID=2751287 RepID=UPI001BE95C7D|nr:hypothetical protein [Exiguobacterium sp. s163]
MNIEDKESTGVNETESRSNLELKVVQTQKSKKSILDGGEMPLQEEDDQPLRMKDMVKITMTLILGYMLFAIVPTLILMKAFDLGFWLSSGITFILAIFLTLGLGLHKPASPEQLAKRDMYKKNKGRAFK